MYSYELVNNHYVVEIDDQKFLIDTGSPFSFWVSHPIKEITIDGNKYPLQNRPLNFEVDETNNLAGVSGLFYKQTPFDHVSDYNPSLGHLDSDKFHLEIVIGGQKKTIDVCSNSTVASTLIHMGALMIGSVSSLYNQVRSLYTKKGKLILI